MMWTPTCRIASIQKRKTSSSGAVQLKSTSPLDEAARLDLVVGIAGHAAYHAGQIQLVRKLTAA
jgi:hypothetical protein